MDQTGTGEVVRVTCSARRTPHEAHFYQSFIVGGAPGPVPSLTCRCPGVTVAGANCLTCERDGLTPETCPVWARHPILGHTGDGNPPPGWSW